MSTAAIIGGSVAAAGIGAVGATQAAGAQAGAAKSAAQLQAQEAANSLAEQQREFNTTQANIAPWLQAGRQGIGTLAGLLSTPGQGLLTPFSQQFQAPTAAQAAATPGYQFTLQQGQNAVQNSAAAQGGLLSTGAQKTLASYTTGLANQTYNDVYNRALAEYQQSYNIFQGNQTNTFNRLAALSGIGQTAATTLGQLGQQAAGNTAYINATAGGQIGNSLLAAGGAQASGYAGLANALSGGINNISQYALLSNLLGQQGIGNPIPGAFGTTPYTPPDVTPTVPAPGT